MGLTDRSGGSGRCFYKVADLEVTWSSAVRGDQLEAGSAGSVQGFSPSPENSRR